MKVEELMIRDIQTCSEDCNLSKAAQMMWENDCGCLPVTDNDGRLLGMITDRDICMAGFFNCKPIAESLVRQVMARHLVTCRPEDEIADALRIMGKNQVRRLPVIGRGGRLVGLLSLSNIARECAAEAMSVAPREIAAGDVTALLAAVSRPLKRGASATVA